MRKTLGLLPPEIRYVECITSMGEFCGFVENAGFQFIKKTKISKTVKKFSNILIENGFDEENATAKKFLRWIESLPDENNRKVRKSLMKVIKMRLAFRNSTLLKKELSETQNTKRFHAKIEEALSMRFTRPLYFTKDLRRKS